MTDDGETINWKHQHDKVRRELIEMGRRASSEIKQLRAANASLAPKADAYDTLRQVLDMAPRRTGGMSEDVAWMIDRRVSELEAEEAPKRKQPEPGDR